MDDGDDDDAEGGEEHHAVLGTIRTGASVEERLRAARQAAKERKGLPGESLDVSSLETDARGRITMVEGEEDVEGQDQRALESEMGFRLEPFNLRQEREEGYFDPSGHYVEAADTTDPWLAQLDATESVSKVYASVTAGGGEGAAGGDGDGATRGYGAGGDDDDDDEDDVDDGLDEAQRRAQLLGRVVSFLAHDDETPRQAMKRLVEAHKAKVGASKAGQRKKRSAQGGAVFVREAGAMSGGKHKSDVKEAPAFDELTEVCDLLLSNGVMGVYSMTKAAFVAELEAAEAQVPRWRYKVSPDAVEYGPFSTAQMYDWIAQSAFPSDLLVADAPDSPNLDLDKVTWVPLSESSLTQ